MIKNLKKQAGLYKIITMGKSFLVVMSQNLHLEPLEKAILYLSFGVFFFFFLREVNDMFICLLPDQ